MSKPRHFGMDAEIQAMEGKLEFAKNIPLSTNQISPQIPPFRIIFFNQSDLGMVLPFFDLLFAKNGTFHVFVWLIPYQGMSHNAV